MTTIAQRRAALAPTLAIEPLYTREDIAGLFRVTTKTVGRWHARGYMDPAAVRTPGGHWRYRAAWIDAWREGRIP
jgi:hypothetical protein